MYRRDMPYASLDPGSNSQRHTVPVSRTGPDNIFQAHTASKPSIPPDNSCPLHKYEPRMSLPGNTFPADTVQFRLALCNNFPRRTCCDLTTLRDSIRQCYSPWARSFHPGNTCQPDTRAPLRLMSDSTFQPDTSSTLSTWVDTADRLYTRKTPTGLDNTPHLGNRTAQNNQHHRTCRSDTVNSSQALSDPHRMVLRPWHQPPSTVGSFLVDI